MHKTESHFQDFAKKEENKKTQVLARWLPCARLRGIMVERDNGGGGLREGIMRYYLGRDYQVDLFTTRYPDDELGRLKKQRDWAQILWAGMFFNCPTTTVFLQCFIYFLFHSLSKVCASRPWGRDVVRPEEQTRGTSAWNVFTPRPPTTLKKLKGVRCCFGHACVHHFSPCRAPSPCVLLSAGPGLSRRHTDSDRKGRWGFFFSFFLKALLCYVLLMPLRWFGLTFADAPSFQQISGRGKTAYPGST